MVARVLIKAVPNAPSIFRVSLPGFDVQNCGLGGLAFDGDYSRRNIFMRGYGLVMTGGVLGLNFPETLPKLPQLYWSMSRISPPGQGVDSPIVIWTRPSGGVGAYQERHYAEVHSSFVIFHSTFTVNTVYINYVLFRT